MKKIISVLLSLILCLGCIIAVPASAASQLDNRVPKTIKIGNGTLTGTYNSKNKTLTYKGKPGNSDVPDYIFLIYALKECSTDTQINRDFTQLILENDAEFFQLAFNDMIRTGKIKTIKINGMEFVFKTKNNHVTSMSYNMDEAGGDDYRFTYDKNGNIKRITETIAEDEYIINHSNNRLGSISIQYGDGSSSKITPQFNDNGIIVGNNVADKTNLDGDYNEDGTLQWCSKQVVYDTGKVLQSPKVYFTYMKI